MRAADVGRLPRPPAVKRTRRRKPAPVLTAEQRHIRDLDRAWRWGQRYSRRRWRRRPPPRFRSAGPRDDAGIATTAAFYRGYDAQTRSMIRDRARRAALRWPVGAAA